MDARIAGSWCERDGSRLIGRTPTCNATAAARSRLDLIEKSTVAYDAIATFIGVVAVILSWIGRG